MKIRKLIVSAFTFAIVIGSITGCATTTYQKRASTSSALTQSSDMIAKGSVLIDETLAKLNDLVSNPSPDLRKQFNAFNNSVNELGSAAKDITIKAEQMKLQGAAYFKNWDKEAAQMQNEDIRQRSEARKNEVTARFNRITESYEATKAACIPYMSDLRDIQKFLSVDLTSEGLVAIKDVAEKATNHAAPLKESISGLSEEFKALGVSMSSKAAIM
ncbi:MAG: DUF2959 family protein [Candidatus Omnitrophica bacterium]|nr:DUF2959 family protein [Candidatus Omnitrophota bacterium]